MVLLSIIFLIIGILAGGVINVLADDLPARVNPRTPHCPRCGHVYEPSHWLALARRALGGECPDCGLPTRPRAILVELGTATLFAILPFFIEPVLDLTIYAIYVAVLVLVIVIDLEHRLILHVVTIPTTIFALLASLLLDDNNPLLAVAGAAAGFVFFLIVFFIGQRLFGAGALGFGDVTLAMTLGAMLGLQRIFFALMFGILLAGVWALIALAFGRLKLRGHFAYGPFLAVGGIVMIIWGNEIYNLISTSPQ
jgi:leader peptidase (prepilin peptidase)/N-methyltransferase